MDATITWTANSESDLAGYLVSHGYASGSYLESITVLAPTTTYTFLGLPDDVPSYFAVTAYDTSGNVSDISDEVSKYLGTQVIGGFMVV